MRQFILIVLFISGIFFMTKFSRKSLQNSQSKIIDLISKSNSSQILVTKNQIFILNQDNNNSLYEHKKLKQLLQVEIVSIGSIFRAMPIRNESQKIVIVSEKVLNILPVIIKKEISEIKMGASSLTKTLNISIVQKQSRSELNKQEREKVYDGWKSFQNWINFFKNLYSDDESQKLNYSHLQIWLEMPNKNTANNNSNQIRYKLEQIGCKLFDTKAERRPKDNLITFNCYFSVLNKNSQNYYQEKIQDKKSNSFQQTKDNLFDQFNSITNKQFEAEFSQFGNFQQTFQSQIQTITQNQQMHQYFQEILHQEKISQDIQKTQDKTDQSGYFPIKIATEQQQNGPEKSGISVEFLQSQQMPSKRDQIQMPNQFLQSQLMPSQKDEAQALYQFLQQQSVPHQKDEVQVLNQEAQIEAMIMSQDQPQEELINNVNGWVDMTPRNYVQEFIHQQISVPKQISGQDKEQKVYQPVLQLNLANEPMTQEEKFITDLITEKTPIQEVSDKKQSQQFVSQQFSQLQSPFTQFKSSIQEEVPKQLIEDQLQIFNKSIKIEEPQTDQL